MKVLLIDVNCKSSSTGKIVYDLYTAVNESGNEAAICFGRGKKSKEHNVFKFGIDIETYIHAFLTRITGFTGCFSPFSTLRLIRFIKKFKPDVVHIHELHAYFVNIKPLINYLKKNKIKTVMTLHCEFAYTGKCGYSAECEQWKTECKKCPHLKEYVSTMWFDHTAYMFKQKKRLFEDFDNLIIVTPSEWVATRARQSFLKHKEIKTIHNGVDTAIFHHHRVDAKALLGVSAKGKIFLSVAPNIMSQRKGGAHILAVATMPENKNNLFIMIGVEDTNIDTPQNVIVLPKTSDQMVLANYYSIADAFLLCSQKETFSMTCAEALCCGTAVLGFRCGAPEVVFDYPYANFVQYGDINTLSNLMNEAIIPTKDEISAYAEKSFSKQIMGKCYLDLYGCTNHQGVIPNAQEKGD